MKQQSRICVLAILTMGCGLPATQSDVKLVGAGLNPDEIGALPDPHGGLIEYNLFDFAGAQLPLGLLGLVSYEGAGPEVNFKPPYKMVFGQGFIFSEDMGNPDAALGSLPTVPSAEDVCQTRYEPRSYLSGLVDVGNRINFRTLGGDGGWSIGRRPFVFPPDLRGVNTYYLELDSWRSTPRSRPVQVSADGSVLTDMEDQILVPANFPEGELVEVSFPGGIPALEVSVGSIPMPLAAAGGNRGIVLPTSPMGVRLGWDGPRYDRNGRIMAEGEFLTDGDTGDAPAEANSTCLQYLPHESAPSTVEDCLEIANPPRDQGGFYSSGGDWDSRQIPGQMYTGPWDTENQELVFEWIPGAKSSGEALTLTVRFLGKVDRDDENLVEEVVISDVPAPNAETAWDDARIDGRIPEGVSLPDSRRAAQTCDTPFESGDAVILRDEDIEVEWPLDAGLANKDDQLIPSLQGDPGHTVSEVTCRLADQDGRFVLTQDMLDAAMDYAAIHGAEGAVFFLSRSTETTIQTPAVRDRYGTRHEISPVKMIGRSVQIGRFWYGQ